MKRLVILAMFAIMIVAKAWAQKPLEFSTVIKQDSLDANALYEATRSWFVESFKDSKAVIKDDNPGKQITGKGTIPFTANMVFAVINGYIEFLIDVQFRDGRLKLTMRNFDHRAERPAMFDNDMGILVDELPSDLGEIGIKGANRKSAYKYYYKNAKPECEGTFKKVVDSLTEFVVNKKAQEEEEW